MTLSNYWQKFTAAPEVGRSWYQIVAWWEARRPAYNMFAGLIWAVAGAIVLLVPATGAELDSPILSAVIFVLVINICYTLGWLAELAWRLISRHDAPEVAPRILKLGLLFTALAPVLFLVLSVLISVM